MMSDILKVFFLSMIPLSEQRATIPLGIIVYQLNPWLVAIVALIGSFVPAPFIYFFVKRILEWMRKIKWLDWFTNFVDKKIQKGSEKLEKYKEVGLITFVGVPLPTTGLWTGTAVAAFLGLNFKKSMFCAFVGGIISAILLVIISMAAPAIIGH